MLNIIKFRKIVDYKTLFFLTLISLIYVLPIFIGGFRSGDDIGFHMSRFHFLSDELSSGNLIPFVFTKMNGSLGYAVGTFYPNFFLYPFALLTLIGVSEYVAFSLYYVFISEISILIFYISAKYILISVKKDKYKVYLGVSIILYYLNFYMFENFYNRGALGEFTASAFLPLIFLACFRIFKENRGYWILGLSVICIFLSHLITAFLVIVCLAVFYLFNIKRLITETVIIKNTAITAVSVIFITAFQWIPMIETYFSTDLYFKYNKNLLGQMGNLTIFNCGEHTLIGVVIILGMCLCGIFFKSSLHRFFEAIFLYLFLNSSLFPWRHFSSVFGMIQFPWRLSSILYYLVLFAFIRVLIEYDSKDLKCMSSMIMVVFVILNIFGFRGYFNYAEAPKISTSYIESVDNVGLMEYSPLYIVKDKMLDENGKFSREKYKKNRGYRLSEINKGNVKNAVYDFDLKVLKTNEFNGNLTVPSIYYPGVTAVSKTGQKYEVVNTRFGLSKIKDVMKNDEITLKYNHTYWQITGFVLSLIFFVLMIGYYFCRK